MTIPDGYPVAIERLRLQLVNLAADRKADLHDGERHRLRIASDLLRDARDLLIYMDRGHQKFGGTT